MTTLSERNPDTQERAIEIVADALRVLRTRDGIAVPDDLIAERARNAVTALEGEFDLEPKIQPTADARAVPRGAYRMPPAWEASVPTVAAGSPFAHALEEWVVLRRQAQEVFDQLEAAQVTEAAVAVAALLADPFDRDARTEARTWLRGWQAAHAARPSTATTPGAAVRS